MTDPNQKQLGNTLWSIADQLRGAMNADDFRDYMLSFLFLRYLSDNYEIAAKKELGSDYPELEDNSYLVPLSIWYELNADDVDAFEKQMRRKIHYIIQPTHLWKSIAQLARTQSDDLLNTLQAGFKYIETESFESTFQGCSLRSTWLPTSWDAPMSTATPSSAQSSRRSPMGWRSFPQISTPLAMPMNT
jgi:type I restriction enzyme M protein